MIRRAGGPEAVSGVDSVCIWRLTLTEAPEREWRRAFLEHATTVGMFHDAGLRVAEATVSLQLDRAHVRAAVDHLDRCIAEANAACGLTDDAPGAAPEADVVLVVDDQSAIVATIAEMLTMQGYSVIEVTDPREALRIARSRRVDVLLTDVVMPVMNGPELARRVLEASPAIKPVFMSAYAVEEALAWGTPFLSKPFSFATLTRAVRDAIDRPSPFRPASAMPSPRAR